MTDDRRYEIIAEAYEGTNGNYLFEGFDGHQWRETADETGNDDAWETSAILIEMDRVGADAVRQQIKDGKF